MNFNQLSKELEQASMFDLWRIDCIINCFLEDPKRLDAIKRHLQPGQEISYFESTENQLVEATVIQVRQKRVLVMNKFDSREWNIPLYMVNLANVDTSIQPQPSGKLDRGCLQVGSLIGWHCKDGNDKYGHITKLNPKLAKVRTTDGENWKVAYSLLFEVMDSTTSDAKSVLTIDDQGTLI